MARHATPICYLHQIRRIKWRYANVPAIRLLNSLLSFMTNHIRRMISVWINYQHEIVTMNFCSDHIEWHCCRQQNDMRRTQIQLRFKWPWWRKKRNVPKLPAFHEIARVFLLSNGHDDSSKLPVNGGFFQQRHTQFRDDHIEENKTRECDGNWRIKVNFFFLLTNRQVIWNRCVNLCLIHDSAK